MSKGQVGIVDAAKGLAHNPLGIIALFIVLVYGFASLVATFANSFTPADRFLLICFLVAFPFAVLGVFTYLVVNHSGKLFSPTDFKDDKTYLMALQVTMGLAAAEAKHPSRENRLDIPRIMTMVQESLPQKTLPVDRKQNNSVLWVDDHPMNNVHERQAIEAVGIKFDLAESTAEALKKMSRQKYAAVISDMERKEGPREGYALLDRMRDNGNLTPLFFYASSNEPEYQRETQEHGGQGYTDSPQEIFQLVTKAVMGRGG